jgi:hypothetical protein
MDKETKEALEGSIEKWRKICEEGSWDQGLFNCPLCHLFHAGGNDCEGCIVRIKAEARFCRNTPYVDWRNHHANEHSVRSIFIVKCDKCQEIAERELEFLKSLREEEKDA